MKLLIFTQAVDVSDTVLGFFHSWIEALAPNFESISVVCLKEGTHMLPENVRVYSLGKESGSSRIKYVFRFFSYLWKLRHNYDAVFVHMNQEYMLLGGLFWRIFGKKTYFWRNFHTGDWKTFIAVHFATRVFYTSQSSYTARFAHGVRMPIGVDNKRFRCSHASVRVPNSVLSIGRIAPVKRLDLLISACGLLAQQGIEFSVDIYGDPLPEDAPYLSALQDQVSTLSLSECIRFYPGIPNNETPKLFCDHDVFVNISPSGMYDKTIIEAASCEAISLASSKDWAQASAGKLSFDATPEDLAKKLKAVFALSETEKESLRALGKCLAVDASLKALTQRLSGGILKGDFPV